MSNNGIDDLLIMCCKFISSIVLRYWQNNASVACWWITWQVHSFGRLSWFLCAHVSKLDSLFHHLTWISKLVKSFLHWISQVVRAISWNWISIDRPTSICIIFLYCRPRNISGTSLWVDLLKINWLFINAQVLQWSSSLFFDKVIIIDGFRIVIV